MQRVVELAYDLNLDHPVYVIDRQEVYNATDLRFVGNFEDSADFILDFATITPEFVRQFRTRPLYLQSEEGGALIDSRPLRIVWTSDENRITEPITNVHQIMLPDLAQPGLVPLNLPPFDPVARQWIDDLEGELTLQNFGLRNVPPRITVPVPERSVELAYDVQDFIPVYVVNRRDTYSALDLHFMRPSDEEIVDFMRVTPEFVQQFRTQPLYLSLEGGYALLDSRPLRIAFTEVGDLVASPIVDQYEIKLPDLTQWGLVELQRPPFDPTIRRLIAQMAGERDLSLQNSAPIARELGVPYVPPTVRGQEEITPPRESELKPILEALIARLYGLPVTPPQTLIVNGLPVPLIPFEEATQMLHRNEVERYTIDPLLQVWAGPPGTSNRIVTLIRRDGTVSAVQARYDPTTNQIYPL